MRTARCYLCFGGVGLDRHAVARSVRRCGSVDCPAWGTRAQHRRPQRFGSASETPKPSQRNNSQTSKDHDDGNHLLAHPAARRHLVPCRRRRRSSPGTGQPFRPRSWRTGGLCQQSTSRRSWAAMVRRKTDRPAISRLAALAANFDCATPPPPTPPPLLCLAPCPAASIGIKRLGDFDVAGPLGTPLTLWTSRLPWAGNRAGRGGRA